MSAQTLQHVREQLQRATHQKWRSKDITFVEYQFPVPLLWADAILLVEDAASRGWLPNALEWQPGSVAVTKLQLIRPAKFSTSQRGRVLYASTTKGAEASTAEGSAVESSEASDVVLEVQNTFDVLPSRTTQSVQSTNVVQSTTQLKASVQDDLQAVVELVLVHYEHKTRKKRTKAAFDKVEALLPFWSVEQLCRAIDQALAFDAKLSCARIFSSRRAVAGWLNEPEPVRERRATWLTEYATRYQQRWPEAKFPYGQWAQRLKALEAQYTRTVVLEQFERYLCTTEPSYVNAQRFYDTCGTFRPKRHAEALASAQAVDIRPAATLP